MDHLVGPEVQVILNLKEGKGFDKVANPTCVTAALDGLTLETNFISQDPCPQYLTNLVWEANKHALRKMRSRQDPLKIEFLEGLDDGIKTKMGYILLSLRTAQIITKDFDGDVKSNWYKVSGVKREVKVDKPEFLLSLIIGDKHILNKFYSNKKNVTVSKRTVTECKSSPYLITDEHLIQLGPVATCKEIFLFSITTESIVNIDALKIESAKSDITNQPYLLWYDIFENAVHSKKIPVKVQSYRLNEVIVIRIRSSLKELRDYFQRKPFFMVILKQDDMALGQAKVEPGYLVNTDSNEAFLKNCNDISHAEFKQYFFENFDDKEMPEEQKPFIRIKLKLQYLGLRPVTSQYSDLNLTTRQSDTEFLRELDSECQNGITEICSAKSCTTEMEPLPVDFSPKCTDSLQACNKITDDLETWKEYQRELFKSELKRKEEAHLNRLNEEWQTRREYLESKFVCNIEQCKMLATNLNSTTDDLRARKIHSLEKEARLIKENEKLKAAYEKKLQELKVASKKMHQDLKSKLSLLEEDKRNLQVQLESVKTENKQLQAVIKNQTDKLEILKKAGSSIMQDQTANLMQDIKTLETKLDSTQKSKTFFKEQWGKAVREIHKMKMEHRQAIEVQIKTSKDDLKNLNLEEILHADTAALTNDKILLGQIQREIDVIRPTPSYISKHPDTYSSTYTARSLMNLKRPQLSAGSEEQDERLRNLIEERESLLKTGSYTTDDAIIVKLNTEIRSLLINS